VAAEYLAERGHPVEIVTRLSHVAPALAGSRDLGSTHARLRHMGVVFTPNHEIGEIRDDRVELRDVHTGEIVVRQPVDAIVLVVGNRAEDGLLRDLRVRGIDATGIGDCLAPRRIFNAIWEGELAARRI
jgi:NADPH-dependent 2,4-dienoyl-CoA reductase/sulfur reductase-like enzyme